MGSARHHLAGHDVLKALRQIGGPDRGRDEVCVSVSVCVRAVGEWMCACGGWWVGVGGRPTFTLASALSIELDRGGLALYLSIRLQTRL